LFYKELKKIYIALSILLLIGVIGIVGYMLIEGFSFLEAFYMTVITVSTVGYKEVKTLSTSGMYFTSGLIVFSLGIFAYNIQTITQFILNGTLRVKVKKLKQLKEIEKIKNHIIVCGFGRNGQQIINELESIKEAYVVIEKDEKIIQKSSHFNEVNYLIGDATEDQVLLDAGIKNAKALISTLPDDSENLFVVLTARGMNNELLIISRASQDSTDKKLRMAGANNVVMPDKVGGTHMASLVVKPDVVEFFNHLSGQDNEISIIEVCYEDTSDNFKDKAIKDLNIEESCGSKIIGLKDKEGKFIINPSPDIVFSENTKLFILGTREQIKEIQLWD
tara:strand:- start:196 stop:1197 length:1002 start_codon:yes stop_codon:yes gene_type:complete